MDCGFRIADWGLGGTMDGVDDVDEVDKRGDDGQDSIFRCWSKTIPIVSPVVR
jgi:hypothetical protein